MRRPRVALLLLLMLLLLLLEVLVLVLVLVIVLWFVVVAEGGVTVDDECHRLVPTRLDWPLLVAHLGLARFLSSSSS